MDSFCNQSKYKRSGEKAVSGFYQGDTNAPVFRANNVKTNQLHARLLIVPPHVHTYGLDTGDVVFAGGAITDG